MSQSRIETQYHRYLMANKVQETLVWWSLVSILACEGVVSKNWVLDQHIFFYIRFLEICGVILDFYV